MIRQLFAVLEHVGDALERIRLGEIMLKAPVPLIGMDVAVIVSKLFGLHETEVESLQSTIPDFAGFAWTPSDIYTVVPSALALAWQNTFADAARIE